MKEVFELERRNRNRPTKRNESEEAESTFLPDEDHQKSFETIPSYYILLVLGYLFVLGVVTALIDDALPNPVSVKDAGIARFSEERAWQHLYDIVGSGPRVAGTKYHLTKTIELKAKLDKIARESNKKIHVDWQLVSGDYELKSKWPFINAYHNLSNIIAVLEGESGFNDDGTTRSSILFNCHYDTVPTSPGASDNALFCATMVETLYLFSKQNIQFKHNIIFLFNGAEENPLQGASGFLKHPWSKGVTALVNLDAAGTNCKSMLFQVTDPRVVRSYSNAVRLPSAHSLGEALFGSGIIPSDTDFRIFRDFGDIYGVDIAFSKVGHVYHTRFDSPEIIKEGVLQHSGDMIYNMAKEMANSDVYYTKAEPSTTIYWDYLNMFMFTYDFTAATVVDAIVLVLAIFSVIYYFSIVGFRKTMYWELLMGVFSRLASAFVGILCVIIVSAILVLTSHQLRYLTNSWLVVPMFWFPYLAGSVLTAQILGSATSEGLSRGRRVCQAMAATRCLLLAVGTVLLFVPKLATIRYLITIPLLWMSLTSFVSLSVVQSFRLKAYQQLLLELFLSIPAQMMFFVVAIKINSLMLPIMGRSVTLKPDYMVAGLNVLVAMLATIPLSGCELLFNRVGMWVGPLVGIVVCALVCCVPMPLYTDDPARPVLQRHYWFHSEIVSYNSVGERVGRDSGIWFGHTEVHTPASVLAHVGLNDTRTQFHCLDHTYCNLPMFYPRTLSHVANSIWVDWDPPSVSTPAPEFTLTNHTCKTNYTCTLEFEFNGPPHMAITVFPRPGVALAGWSLDSPLANNTALLDRPVYFVYYTRPTHADNPPNLHINFTFQGDVSKSEIVDISFHAHRIDHPEEFTASYKALVAKMPSWFNIATFLSTRHNYVF